jgi:hypothetical protein
MLKKKPIVALLGQSDPRHGHTLSGGSGRSFRSAGLELENCFNPIPWAISLCGILVDVLGLGISGSKSAVQVENSESVKMKVTSTVLHMLCR